MRLAWLAGPACVLGVFLVLGGCPAPTKITLADPTCQAGDFVFCKCADSREGTKLCMADGQHFEDCDCGPKTVVIGGGDFEPIDAGGEPPPDTPKLDNKCAGKLGVLAGAEEDLFVYGAAYVGDGKWAPAKSNQEVVRSVPRGGLVDNALVTVWQSRNGKLVWTKFQASQTSMAKPLPVGLAQSDKAPTMGSDNAAGRVFYIAADNAMKEGTYTGKSGWNDATTTIGNAEKVGGKGAPAVSLLNGSTVLAFTDTFKTVFVQTQSNGTWDAPFLIAGTKSIDDEAPAMTPLRGSPAGPDGGAPEDLIIAYRGTDTILRYLVRSGGTAWEGPLRVDTTAAAEAAPTLTSMSNGRALLAWQAAGGEPFFSIYDASKTPRWSVPAAMLKETKVVRRSPFVSPSRCTGEVGATLIDTDGNVFLSFYTTGKGWSDLFQVPGMTNMNYGASGEVP